MDDYKEIESKWQMRWREAGAFEANPDPQRPKFFLTSPYPYANAPLHAGHGRTYTISDIVVRYKRMRGFNVLWPMAAHVTGTPVFGVAKRIREKDPIMLKEYQGSIALYRQKKDVKAVLSTFTDPMAIAHFFAGVFEGDFRKMGYSIDWRRKFTTNDTEYQAFITWQFLKLNELGYITKGQYPILYCVACGNAVGEHDLLEGEDAKITEFVALKFPYEDGYLVAATLRPETVYGVTNVWVNPDATYIKIQVGEEFWYIATPAARKLVNQGHRSKRLEEIPGTEFIGKTCKSPVDDRELLILPGPFVDPNNATGIVYSVPSHAPYDWVALHDLQKSKKATKGFQIDFDAVSAIQPISIISVKGYGEHPAIELSEKMKIKNQKESKKLDEATDTLYRAEYYGGIMKDNTGPFAGRKVNEIKEDVVSYLQDKNRAFLFFQPDRQPVTCRCGNEIVVAVLPDQWFINYGNPDWKKQATKALANMTIFPNVYRSSFQATFEWLKERPCARRRGLGTPLPFDRKWVIESLSDSTIYMSYYLLIHHIKANNIEPQQLTNAFFDYTLLGKGDITKLSEQTNIAIDVLETMRKEVEYWYPNDQRHSGHDLITSHLSFFIFHHTAIFPERMWPKAITINEFLTREGEKMSKSRGNVIPLGEIPRRFGADLFRLYITQTADLATPVDWREKDVVRTRRRMNRLTRIFKEVITSKEAPLRKESLSLSSQWILSKVNSIIHDSTILLENFRFRDFILKAFFELQGHVEYYLRRIDKSHPERGPVLRYVITHWIKLLAPIIPHLCEEVWEQLGSISFVSIENWPVPDEDFLDKKIEDAMDVVNQTIADIKEIQGLLKDKTPTTVHIYVSQKWKYSALKRLVDSEVALTVKELMSKLMKDTKLRKRGKEVNELVQAIVKASGYWTFVDKTTEMQALEGNSELIQLETGLVVVVQDGDKPKEDPGKKAHKALPGRPALFIE
ncbi:MAG: leucine--tRNA ligase [Promethearchaeota archaeon]